MSAIVVICIEGVLAPVGETLPTAHVVPSGLRLVQTMSSAWQIAYVSETSPETAIRWLREVGAPTWCWVAEAQPLNRAGVILRKLGERQDRAAFVVAPDFIQLDTLAEAGASTMVIAYSDTFALGDWKIESTWADSEPEEEEDATGPHERSRGSDPSQLLGE